MKQSGPRAEQSPYENGESIPREICLYGKHRLRE